MNIFDLLESPGMGRPRDTTGVQSAADQSAASVIGSGTTKHEAKKKPVRMMGAAVKESVEEAAVKPNFKMPPESLQDKMYRQHQELRKQRGAPSPEEYKQRIAQKQAEIDALKEAHPNQQAALYNPDGPTYRQQKMPGYDIDDIYSRGQAVDLDPEVGDINAPEDHLDAAEKANLKKILKQYTDRLNPLQRNVIFLRYWDDHTLESAGKILGVTPERVRQIEARALRYIRQYDKENSKDLLGLSKRKTYEGILDRATPKMPKPRNPANAVLGNKVNAGGRHLDKKRRQELNPKHKHQDPLEEGWKDAVAGAALAGSIALGGMAHAGEPVMGQGQSQNMQMAVDMAKHNAKIKYMKTVHGDNFQDKQMPEYRFGKVELKPGKDGGYQATVPIIVDSEVQNESLRPGEYHTWTVHFADGTSQQVNVPSDEFDVRAYFAKRNKQVVKVDRNYAIQGQQQDQARPDNYDDRADRATKAHIQHDRGLTEQDIEEEFRLGKKLGTRRDRFKSLRKRKDGILGEVEQNQVTKITDYDLWLDEVKALGAEIHPQKDRNVLVAQSWDGEEIGKFHLGKEYGFINRSGELDETIRKMGSQYRLLSKKGKNLGTFDSKAGAEKHEREVQYFKHANEDISRRGFLKGLGAAALAGAVGLGSGSADAQNIDLPGPQAVMIAHIQAEVNGREISRTVNLGTQYQSEQQAEQELEEYMQSKGITRYNIRIEQRYDQPNTGYGAHRRSSGYATGSPVTGPVSVPNIGDMVSGRINREIRAGIPSKGGYATGGTNRGQRPRDGSQWWRDQLPQIMKEEPLEEDIERHLLQMRRAGYDIVQEEWSDKYKSSINCSNPKGFSQKAHCAGKKKNESVAEEKVRLDPKCWTGKKIGNPKTKIKGGVRVNNCVPK
jgi:RNA polymerase sigma factor (sigma-70 family)